MYRISHRYLIKTEVTDYMSSPAERDSERKGRFFLECYLTMNTLAQLPMWFICSIITVQLSNVKGFQIILRKAAADQGFSVKSEETPLGINDLSLESCSAAIPKKEPHTLSLAGWAPCSQKQIKTSDTKRTLIAMVTVVWGQTINWSSFKDQVRAMRHRSWITVLKHSPAQVLLPAFSSVYSSPLPLLFPCVRKGQEDFASELPSDCRDGYKRYCAIRQLQHRAERTWAAGAHQEVHTTAPSKSAMHGALQSHQHFWQPRFHQYHVRLEHRERLPAEPCWSATISSGLSKGARWPPNLQYCHPDPMVLLRRVNKLPSWGD